MSDVKLQTTVSRQLPEFIREDYLTFTKFIEAYYEYLESVDARDIEDLRNIDNTVYEYLIYMNNETGFLNSPDLTLANIDTRLFLRKTRQVFIAKGTENSYKFLFRLLYKKPVEISYPWKQTLIPSDGKWKQDTSIFVQVTSGDALAIVGDRVTILGNKTNIKVHIDRAVPVRDDIYELFIDKSFYGSLLVGDTVTFETFNATIIPTTERYIIDYAGTGYKIGDLIVNNIPVNEINVQQILKVTRVNSVGGILAVSTVKFGYGYGGTFTVTALKNVPPIINSRISTKNGSVVKYSAKDTSSVSAYSEVGSIINNDVVDVTYTHPFYAGTVVNQFTNNTDNLVDMSSVAVITCYIGSVAKYQGYYTSSDGFLDDDIRIQDSKYYQKYSYLLTVDERLSDYKSYIKSFIHPAGLALFGEYQIQNSYTPGIEGSFYLDEYISKATFITKSKVIPNDYTFLTNYGVIKKNAYDEGSYVLNTYNPPLTQTQTFTR